MLFSVNAALFVERFVKIIHTDRTQMRTPKQIFTTQEGNVSIGVCLSTGGVALGGGKGISDVRSIPGPWSHVRRGGGIEYPGGRYWGIGIWG